MGSTKIPRVLVDLRPGDHLAHFYDTDAEHHEILITFLQQGLMRGERVVCWGCPESPEAIRAGLQAEGVPAALCRDPAQLLFLPSEDLSQLTPAGDSTGVLTWVQTQVAEALAQGFSALRLVVEMGGADCLRDWYRADPFLHHEGFEVLRTLPYQVLCQYDRRIFDSATLLRAMEFYPYLIIRTELYNNFYALPIREHPHPDAQLQYRIRKLAEFKEQETALRQRNLMLATVKRAGRILYAAAEMEPVLTRVLVETNRLLDGEGCALWLFEPEMGGVVCRYAVGALAGMLESPPLPVAALGWDVAQGVSLTVADDTEAERYFQGVPRGTAVWRSLLCVPLQANQQWLGVLVAVDSRPGCFTPIHLALLESLAPIAAAAIHNLHLYQETNRLRTFSENLVRGVEGSPMLKQAEEALRLSEARYRRLVELSPNPIAQIDLQGRVLLANLQAARLCGMNSAEELEGINIADLVLPTERMRFPQHLARLQQNRHLSRLEYTLVWKNGRALVVEVNISLLQGIDDQPESLVLMLQDITERKRVEEQLRRDEQQYRRLVEKVSALMYIAAVDEYSTTTYISPQVEWILGVTADDYLRNPKMWIQGIYPDDRERVLAELQESRKQGKPFVSEYRMLARDGRVVWFRDEATLVYDAEGRPMLRQGLMVDITERKQMELALRESEERLRLLIESSEDIVLLHGLSGEYLYYNGPARYGIQPEWLLGKNPFDVFDPEAAQFIINRVRKVAETGEPVTTENSVTWLEETLWFSDSIFPVRDAAGRLTAVGGICRNITERKRAEQALQRSEERFQQLALENARLLEQARQDAETKATLLREVNHRVKNNLSALIGLLYAEQRYAQRENQALYQVLTQELANRIEGMALVHNMLSASGWVALPLDELIRQIIRVALKMLPHEKRVHVDVPVVSVRVPPRQANSLALVINELATNALKYALGERPEARIQVQIIRQEERVQLEFRDDGPGYPEDVLRLERHNVGLYLVQTLVRHDLRGDLTLHNDSGAVTTLWFKLPTQES